MITRRLCLGCFPILVALTSLHAFSIQSTFMGRPTTTAPRVSLLSPVSSSQRRGGGGGGSVSRLQMRDTSASYWFRLGNSVRVVDDVDKAGHNLKHRLGKVVETWEKCDVDPTCCCAEQVDLNMAVRVEFPGTEADETVEGVSFYHYFAEKELEKVQEAPAFDGMTCKAFKLDVLNTEQKPRSIASFEPSRPDDVDSN